MKNKLQNQLLLIFLLSIQVAIPPHINAMEGRKVSEDESRGDGGKEAVQQRTSADRNTAALNENRKSVVPAATSDLETGTGTTTASLSRGGGGGATPQEGESQDADGLEAEDRLNEDPNGIERMLSNTSRNIEEIITKTEPQGAQSEQSSRSRNCSFLSSNTQPPHSNLERLQIGQARQAIAFYIEKIKPINSTEEENASVSVLRESRASEIQAAWQRIDTGVDESSQRLGTYDRSRDAAKIAGAEAKISLLKNELTQLLKSKTIVSNIELSLREKLEALDLEELKTKEAPIFQGLAQAALLLHNNYKYINFVVERVDYVLTLEDQDAQAGIHAVKKFERIMKRLVTSTDRLVHILKLGDEMNMSDFICLRQEVEKLSNVLDAFYKQAMNPIYLDEESKDSASDENIDRRTPVVGSSFESEDLEQGISNFYKYLRRLDHEKIGRSLVTLKPQVSTQRTTACLSTGSPAVGGGDSGAGNSERSTTSFASRATPPPAGERQPPPSEENRRPLTPVPSTTESYTLMPSWLRNFFSLRVRIEEEGEYYIVIVSFRR